MSFRIPRRFFTAAVLAGLLGDGLAQEACLKGCAYPTYPGLFFTLGDGFVAKGGEEVRVTHMGFLGSVYNNDGITPRKVGLPDYIGELSVIDPVTGEEKFLFRNQADWVTHANDSGKVVSLGVYPKGAPVVFKYVNVDGKTNGYKTFPRYSGDNVAGVYDFNADPLLRNLAINGKPKPVSGGSWNWEGKNYNLWCVAADVPGTGEKQFQFEDADDRIFNDIVFRVSGVALTSETHKLDAPAITGIQGADGNHKVTLTAAAGAVNQGATIFYTTDGTTPEFDSAGTPKGSTRKYTGPIDVTQTATLKAAAWKPTATSPAGTIRYSNSPVAEATFTVTRRKLAAPAATPPGGLFTGPVSVTLSQSEGARIHYRLCDIGAACPDPDASSPAYSAPIPLTTPKVIKAIAILPPHLNSDVATFTFRPGKWSAPAASPAGGEFSGNLNVTLSQAEGAKIHYRLCEAAAACPDPDAASPAYAGPLAISGGAKVVKAIAMGAPHANSDVAAFAFSPVFSAGEAVYLDRDGDGRIESVRIAVTGAPAALPAGLSLTDPFGSGRRDLSAAELRWESDAHRALLADFPAKPFAFGTGFAAAPLAAFTAGAGYTAAPILVRDGAGPVAVSAVSEVSLDSTGTKRLTVKFSEPLASGGVPGLGAAAALPFAVTRKGQPLTDLEVLSVTSVTEDTWIYAFSAARFPLPGDSLKAVAPARDKPGNPTRMAAFIPVTGDPPTLPADIQVEGAGCARGGPLASTRVLRIPLSVVDPGPATPAGATGCSDIRATANCLDCRTGEWRSGDAARPGPEGFPPAPEIKVKTRWPFRFDLKFFNTLGEAVNGAQGQVTESMLKQVPADGQGYRTVNLRWYPVGANGAQAGTGAYIVKGSVSIGPEGAGGALDGMPVAVQPVSRKVLLRFGYVRQ